MNANIHEHRGDETPTSTSTGTSDPITTQIVRNALTSAARQMVKTTIRTAFSPVIYESLDFAVVLYDAHFRLLGQGPTLPAFMGTMSFCIQGAVEAVGGSHMLQAGDVLLYNEPYGTGSHAQDCAIIMPVYDRDRVLIGYAANKAHQADIGALAPYCTDTTDVFQEGTVFPGVKLYEAGVLNDTVRRIMLANSRYPTLVDGDVRAQIASCHVGASELVRVVERFGRELFAASVERMFDHGESVVRAYLANIPDGTYRADCFMDDNGVDDKPIKFEVAVRIDGSDVVVDYTEAPDAQVGPVNCPLPSTVSLSRITIAMIAGNQESPNEGHFRPLRVLTRPGSMFHPLKPSPCYLYGWSMMSAMEGLTQALAGAVEDLPSGTAGDISSIIIYGENAAGEAFNSGGAVQCGNGASCDHDGAILFVPSLAHSRSQSPEIIEAKAPVRVELYELVADTAGAGRHRGGSGWRRDLRLLVDSRVISTLERTRDPSWAQHGGESGAPNRGEIQYPDGRIASLAKVTSLAVPAQSVIRVVSGGGGGFGAPGERAVAAVKQDLKDGIITSEFAATHYPQAL